MLLNIFILLFEQGVRVLPLLAIRWAFLSNPIPEKRKERETQKVPKSFGTEKIGKEL